MNGIKLFDGYYMTWSKEQLQEWGESCFIYVEQVCKHYGIDLDFKSEDGQNKLNALIGIVPGICSKQENKSIVVYAICSGGINKYKKMLNVVFLQYDCYIRYGGEIKERCLHSKKYGDDDIVFFIFNIKK